MLMVPRNFISANNQMGWHDFFFSMQDRVFDYEWSDGTRFGYNVTISEGKDRPAPDQYSRCVLVNTTGAWVKTNCNAVSDGALCYTTNITTASQSKRPMTYRLQYNILLCRKSEMSCFEWLKLIQKRFRGPKTSSNVFTCIYITLICGTASDHYSFHFCVAINQELDCLLRQRPITALRATVRLSGYSMRITVMPLTSARTSTTFTAFKRPETSVRTWVSRFMFERFSLIFIWCNGSPPTVFSFFPANRCWTANHKVQRGEWFCVKVHVW